MSIDIKGAAGREITSGSSGRTQATASKRSRSSAPQATSGSAADTVNITDAAAQLQALAAQIASLPMEDTQHVSDIQRSIASGNYQFEPEDAAENLLTQEREFATKGDTE